ncbi:6-hydroxymethylpterin diphosphokinase MptE-like protein [Chrysiogenes arsenatis]|uniref:6-hydroxymethylpterin diphosphokinase MptE-like protein n=1 Tax=Chrysiogenes arsenatis TaxID=309797 RepID=UPI0004198B66|nr:6-hydroxymethylpterin diphosphokinase MptE-like protein [Chrysiogenes arsenatis]
MSRIAINKDAHKDCRGFLVATGPSLTISDLDMIKGNLSLSCNKIYLAFDQTEWRPDYYSVIDRLVAQNNAEAIASVRAVKIFSSVIKPFIQDRDDIFWLKDLPTPVINGIRQPKFSGNIAEGTYGGHTVTYTLMQAAYHLGIKELFLLGLDFSFDKSMPANKTTDAGENILVQNDEVNHFHNDYRKKGEEWTVPRLDIQYDAFKCAKAAFEKDNRKIFNASRKTMLDLFPLVQLEDILV